MHALILFESRLTDMLDQHLRQQLSRRAAKRAMRTFSRLHQEWYESAFNEGFLARLPKGLLETKDATALAREWTRQFRYEDERRRGRDVRQLLGVAESFLALLTTAEEGSEVRFRMFANRQRESRLAIPEGEARATRTPGAAGAKSKIEQLIAAEAPPERPTPTAESNPFLFHP